MNRQSFRSPLARAIGLGSAKSGVQHWWAERVTAVALVPLCLWFVASIIAHAGSDYASLHRLDQDAASQRRLHDPVADRAISSSALGLQVVIEDYVHSGVKFAAVIAVRLCCYGLAVVGIIAIVRIAFGG